MDLVTHARGRDDEIETPSAIVEMSLKAGGAGAVGENGAIEKVRFEMSKEDLTTVMSDIGAIQECLGLKT